MKNVKIVKRVVLIILAVIILNVLASIGYGFYMNGLLHEIYDANGVYSEKLTQKVSEDMYHRMDFRSSWAEYNVRYTEYVSISFPLVLNWFAGGTGFYWYTYERRDSDTGEVLCGSADIPVRVTFHMENWHIIIDEKYEKP